MFEHTSEQLSLEGLSMVRVVWDDVGEVVVRIEIADILVSF